MTKRLRQMVAAFFVANGFNPFDLIVTLGFVFVNEHLFVF